MAKIKGKIGIIAVVTLLVIATTAIFGITSFWSKSSEAFTEFFVVDEDPTIDASVSLPSDPSVEGENIENLDIEPLSRSERVFYGTSGADCIKFGHVKQGGVSRGIGICRYTYTNYTCGSFQARDYAATTYDIYKVSAGSGNDFVRYAGNEESCGSGWTIDDNMPVSGSGKQQLFWGDGGNDALFTCYSGNSSTCWSNVDRRADGRDGNDILRGGYYTDTLWGGSGTDEMYGYGGSDTLYGWTGADCLYGGNGDDYLYGEAGADWLHGGANDDDCYCGTDLGNDAYCEWTDGNCTDETITDCFI